MEENNKVSSMTKDELKDLLMETLAEFNVNKFIPERDKHFEGVAKPFISQEIKTSEQRMMNYTDKQTGVLKGELVSPLKKEDEKLEKVTEKLGDKKVFNTKDVGEIKSIKVFAKVA
ncbi:MAG: hypothetical protein PHU42_03715 [Patescibacteria group bacterium]|nr:hypothetical protein [Patescibacteria group bacterium]